MAGFCFFVNHLKEHESKPLRIECKLDINLMCTIIRCDPGVNENCKVVTLEMRDGRRQKMWMLSLKVHRRIAGVLSRGA
jgi:hypothetical protein